MTLSIAFDNRHYHTQTLVLNTPMNQDFQLYRGDCLEIMRKMADKMASVAITDPPYGIKITGNEKPFGDVSELSRKATAATWDDEIPTRSHFDQLFRISENQIIFGGNYFWEYLYASPCYIIWDKRGNMPAVPFADTEFAWTSYQRMNRKYTVINHGFIRDDKDIRYHPTQKPLSLMRMIIDDFTKPGDVIIDPYMGSGSTGVAAIEKGRRFIGCEINPTYFDIALKRITDASRAANGQPKQLNGNINDYADSPLFAGLEG